MDFAFTEEQELFRKTVRQYAERELRPAYADREHDDYPLRDLLARMGDLDLLGLRVPVEYGGSDAAYVTAGIAIEECARGDINVATLIVRGMITSDAIAHYGTDPIKRQWLPEIAAGRKHLAVAVTEPHCGSDAGAITTQATREGDEYVITGEKAAVAQINADACLVFARTSPSTGARGVSCLLVPLDAPGATCTRYADLGTKFARRGGLHLHGVRVPAENLIGEEGQGFYIAMNEFDYSRAVIGLECIGAAQQSVDDTVEYVKTRNAFGQLIARFQGVAFPIAEAAAKLEAARLVCYKTLWMRDRGLPHTTESAIAKWLAPRQSVEVIHQMLLLHGHSGYTEEYPHAQRLRDTIGHQLSEGTAEIMRLIIARDLIGREFKPR